MKQLKRAAVAEICPYSEIERLEIRVQGQLCGRIRELRVLAHDYGLILRGFAHTYYAKQLAQHAVMTETSLPIHANEIVVG